MTATIKFSDGTSASVPAGKDATVKFEWDVLSDDGFKTVHNEEAFALADVTGIELDHDEHDEQPAEPAAEEPAVDAATEQATPDPATPDPAVAGPAQS